MEFTGPEQERAEAFLLDHVLNGADHLRMRSGCRKVVPNGKALNRARELAELYLKAPEVTRKTRVPFHPAFEERIVREVGYGLSLEGASAATSGPSMQAKNQPAARKEDSELSIG